MPQAIGTLQEGMRGFADTARVALEVLGEVSWVLCGAKVRYRSGDLTTVKKMLALSQYEHSISYISTASVIVLVTYQRPVLHSLKCANKIFE
jgi:hypothetical protein